jgi:5-methylcytosine-specific restriction protein A
MSSALSTHVGAAVSARTGIPIAAELVTSDLLRLEPSGYGRHEAFSVEVRTGWRNAQAVFVPAKFAKPLIRNMGQAPEEGRIAFAALAALAERYARLQFRVNGAEISPAVDAVWPTTWDNLELSLRRHGVVPEETSPLQLAAILSDLAVHLFAMTAALSGIDESEFDTIATEGTATESMSRRYERRTVNREICIALKGAQCWCCGLDFGKIYGPQAVGFIEVHHRLPVSTLHPGYKLHPARDLFPVCSNCHSAIHLSKPPEDPEDLRVRLRTTTS